MDFNDIKKKLSKIYVASVKLGRLMINNKDWLKDCVKGDFKDWNTETSDSLNALSIVARDGEILRNCDADIADFNEAKKLISSKANSRIVNKYYYLAKKEQDFKHLTELGDKFADSDIKLLKDLTGKVNFSKIDIYNHYIKNFGLFNNDLKEFLNILGDHYDDYSYYNMSCLMYDKCPPEVFKKFLSKYKNELKDIYLKDRSYLKGDINHKDRMKYYKPAFDKCLNILKDLSKEIKSYYNSKYPKYNKCINKMDYKCLLNYGSDALDVQNSLPSMLYKMSTGLSVFDSMDSLEDEGEEDCNNMI